DYLCDIDYHLILETEIYLDHTVAPIKSAVFNRYDARVKTGVVCNAIYPKGIILTQGLFQFYHCRLEEHQSDLNDAIRAVNRRTRQNFSTCWVVWSIQMTIYDVYLVGTKGVAQKKHLAFCGRKGQ